MKRAVNQRQDRPKNRPVRLLALAEKNSNTEIKIMGQQRGEARNKLQRIYMIKRYFTFFCVVLPLILLAFDFFYSPTIFNSRTVKSKISSSMLVEAKYVPVGTLSGHNIGIVFDKVRNSERSRHVSSNSGFVIPVFVSEGEVSLSELGVAVREKIASSSAESAEKLASFLKGAVGQKPGSVISLALDTPDEHSFPFNNLVIVFLPSDIQQNDQLLELELRNITREAELLKLSTLVVPMTGFSWRDRKSTDLDAFFSAALKSLENRKYPTNYLLNFYSDWPTFVVEHAVHSFNTTWSDLARDPIQINHLRLRLILIMTSLCLGNIFFRKKREFNISRYLVILSTFYVFATGLADFLKLFCIEDTIVYALCLLVTLLVLTVFFVTVSKYSVEGFFKGWRKSP
jgi:hypothetical protein